MKAYLSDTILGLFVLNEHGEVLDLEYYRDVKEASESITEINRGVLPEVLEKILPRLKRYEKLITDNPRIAELLGGKGFKVELVKNCSVTKEFRESLPEYALNKGLIRKREEIDDLERMVLYEIAKAEVRGVSARRDLYAAQMIRALDDIDKSINLFSGRIREWYGFHFPELDKMVDSHEVYAKLILKVGKRENWNPDALKDAGIHDEEARKLIEAARDSIGADMLDEDLDILQSFCKTILNLFDIREKIALHLEKVMMEVAPNLASIIGSSIAARLISLAGGIDNLAKMPASTIQVLGAEKALFRALKTGTRPPKHGVIFQYAPLHQSPRWQRGKIARALAAKIAIAARLDAYNGEFKGDELRADLERRIAEIKSRYKSPPKKVKRRGRKRKGKTS